MMSETPTSSNPSEASMKLAHDWMPIELRWDDALKREMARTLDAHTEKAKAQLKQHFRAALAQARQVAANSSASAEGVVKMLEEAVEEPLPWICTNPKCGARYAEYVNGCPRCSEGVPGKNWSVVRQQSEPSQQNAEPPRVTEQSVKTWVNGDSGSPAASRDVAMEAAEMLDQANLTNYRDGIPKRQALAVIRDIIHEKVVKPLEEKCLYWEEKYRNADHTAARLRREQDDARAELAALRAQPPAPNFDAAVKNAWDKLAEKELLRGSRVQAEVLIESAMRPAFVAAEKRAAVKFVAIIDEHREQAVKDARYHEASAYVYLTNAVRHRFGLEQS